MSVRRTASSATEKKLPWPISSIACDMATGKTTKTALDFAAARLSGSSSQSSSSGDGRSASKKHKTTGTTTLNATDFTTNKVDVDKALLKVETKEAQTFTCRACNSPYTDRRSEAEAAVEAAARRTTGFVVVREELRQERKASASTGA
jgi:hypothetical protein